MKRIKKNPEAKRYLLFQRLANWVPDTTLGGGTRAFTKGGLIGEIDAYSRRSALEAAADQYPLFRGTVEVREWGEPTGEDKWHPCLEESSGGKDE